MIRSGQCGICGSAYKTIISTTMRAWDLRLAMGYSSDILENVQAFLASQNAGRQNPKLTYLRLNRLHLSWDMASPSIKSKERLTNYYDVQKLATKSV